VIYALGRSLEFNKLFEAPVSNNAWNLIKDSYAIVGRGRDAIELIAKELKLQKDDEVLVPAFSCEIITTTILKYACVKFYDINEDLSINIDKIKEKISLNTKAIFFIHYFGFYANGVIEELEEIGLPLIEDATHMWFNGRNNYSDYYLASLRKLLPVPMGCVLTGRHFIGRQTIVKFLNFNALATEIIRCVGLLCANIYQQRPSSLLKWITSNICWQSEKYLETRNEIPKITALTKQLLKGFDVRQENAERRIRYELLAAPFNLRKEIKLIRPFLLEEDCPFAIPLRVQNQELWRRAFIYSGIQALALWKLSRFVKPDDFPVATKLASEILLVPLVAVDAGKNSNNIYNKFFDSLKTE